MLFLLSKDKVSNNLLLNDLYEIIEQHIPLTLCEEWDNSGKQIYFNKQIKKILLALDPSSDVSNYGIYKGFDLIITHHPLFFKPIKTLSYNEYPGKIAINLIKSNISLLSLHTNLDKMSWGTSVSIAEKLGLPVEKPIIPEGDWGLGVIGTFKNGKSISEIIDSIKKELNEVHILTNCDPEDHVTNYALCGGTCFDIADKVKSNNIDLFITSDIKYHEMGESTENNFRIISIDHFWEKSVMNNLKKMLEKWLNGYDIEIEIFGEEQSYLKYL